MPVRNVATALGAGLLVGIADAGASIRGAGLLRMSHLGVDVAAPVPPANATGPSSLVAASKPIRIARGGAGQPKPAEDTHISGNLRCGLTHKVTSSSDKRDRCPEQCPFFAQNRNDKDFCTFACVPEEQCRLYNPSTQIGDKGLGVCRSCVVDGCEKCDAKASTDRCEVCQGGYVLKEDGLCHFKYAGPWMNYVGAFFAVVGVLVVLWVLDMVIRPCTNEQGLNAGLEARESMKLRMPKDSSGDRPLWPLTTNLMSQLVAGPGMTLHFNFQFALIVWAVFIALIWICLAQFVDNRLWLLGTRRFGTPRENCILVAWGYEVQNELMWTKVLFLWIAYLGSFALWFTYAVMQLRAFQNVDYQNKTMKDFVAMVIGLPSVSGEKPVEEDIKAKIQAITEQEVVGVSVAWDYAEHEEDITKALEKVVSEMDPDPNGPPAPSMNPVRQALFNTEKSVFGLPDAADPDAATSEAEEERDPIESVMSNLRSSPRAFVVFPSQEVMEESVRLVNMPRSGGQVGFEYEGAQGITLEMLEAEPDTVQWVNFGHSTPQEKALKLFAGFGIIGLACLFWAIVFYAPYAYYVMTFNYENGRQPGFIVGFAFSMIVVVGNAIMYEVCAQISDWVGFRFKDNREACYMILYTIACMFNVALDFVTTYATAEKVMEGLGFRTYFGVPLQDVTEFTAKFETYGMQRSLAENTYSYAFPSTYLIPFLIEPFPAVLAPLWVGQLIVRSHPEVQGRAAEEWLGMAEMEMGRYADLLLNTILGVLIFYFPGGYTWILFLGMAGSHVYIYAFDHIRVLRSIPSCTFASYDIEWWAQALMGPIIGVMASCLVFKSNCEPGCHCLRGVPLILLCSAAWLAHVILHVALLVFVVPKFGTPPPEEDPAMNETFETLNSRVPCSWFTSNPVHCLRSKYFYKNSPSCVYYVRGREYLMKANRSIGQFFEAKKTDKKA